MTQPDRSVVPVAGPYRELALPKIETFELPNGLRVQVVRRPQLPEVSVRLVLEAGAALARKEHSGVASLTAEALTEGAGGRNAEEMARWLDRLGAAFQASVDQDGGAITIHTLSDELGGSLDFMATAVMSPHFEKKEVDRLRQERLDRLLRRQDDAANVAADGLMAALYGDHPYGRPILGLPDTIGALGPGELQSFHDTHMVPEGSTLLLCGDVAPQAVADLVERKLGGWSGARTKDVLPETPSAPVIKAQVLLLDRPGSAQAEIRLGAIGLRQGHRDEFDVTVANAILGGLFNSRINMNLREDKGWTYGARTSFAFRHGRGPFVARAAVASSVVAEALQVMLDEIAGMLKNLPSDEEIRLAKNALTLSLPRQFETSGQITAKMARQVRYGLPEDYWATYRRKIEDVRRDNIVMAIRSYLHRDGLVCLAAADAEAAGPALEALGSVQIIPSLQPA
ncbi:MAG: pitrilysin family protein [Gemmatimonadota bacterium]